MTNEQGDEDGAPGWDNGRRGGDEQVGNHHREGGVDHEQQEEDDHQEERAAAGADVAAGQRTDGLAAVALGGPQSAEIMHTGEEHGAERDP